MSTSLARKNLDIMLPRPVGSLEAYIQAVNGIPVLSAAQERELATRFHTHNDLESARRLVLSHLRFVVYVARGYTGYGLALADLIQEGTIGLMKAVKRFDPTLNVRLISFAVHWIRAEIHEFILRNWRTVKVATTKAQRKLFFNLRSAKKRLGWLNREEVDAVARDLGVKPETVLEMESRMSGHDIAFDGHPDADEEDENNIAAPASYLQDTRYEPEALLEESDWEQHHTRRLQRALQSLDARSREIVQRRWLNDGKATLQDLADRYQVSAERIRQLEENAMKKLRLALAG